MADRSTYLGANRAVTFTEKDPFAGIRWGGGICPPPPPRLGPTSTGVTLEEQLSSIVE